MTTEAGWAMHNRGKWHWFDEDAGASRCGQLHRTLDNLEWRPTADGISGLCCLPCLNHIKKGTSKCT